MPDEDGAMSGKPGRSGRKSFVATADQRNNVKILVGLGVPQAMICQLVVNPQTGKPLDEGTLKKHFSHEIAVGAAELHARMGSFYGSQYLRHAAAGRHAANQERVVARIAVDLFCQNADGLERDERLSARGEQWWPYGLPVLSRGPKPLTGKV
jgi:hypothetical protein